MPNQSAELGGGFERVGRYQILLDLGGEGTFSLMIAKLFDPAAGPRVVELLRLGGPAAREIEVKEAFLAEARAAGRVRHPNFMQPIDAVIYDGDLHVATDFTLGVRLDELWRSAAAERYEIPLPVSLRIVLDVLAGLSALHAGTASRPMVHGDVCPANVVVSYRGAARLVHSGLSSVTKRVGSLGERNFRLAYKAPEQLRAGIHAVPVAPSADVFAAGVMLWEAVQQARLFEHDTDVEVVEHVLHGAIPELDVREYRYMLQGLAPVVARALDRDADRRFANAALLGEAIERAAGVRLAPPAEVAAVVDALMAPHIDRRRTQIDELIAASERDASQAPLGSHFRRLGSMRTPMGVVFPPPSPRPSVPSSGAFSGRSPDPHWLASSPAPSSEPLLVTSAPISPRVPSGRPSRSSQPSIPDVPLRSIAWLYYLLGGMALGIVVYLIMRE